MQILGPFILTNTRGYYAPFVAQVEHTHHNYFMHVSNIPMALNKTKTSFHYINIALTFFNVIMFIYKWQN